MMTISERLDLLRSQMRREGIDAFIFPSDDPHGSEYVAPHWQSRRWVSGFTGSAGTAVVTLSEAALWTDSRYFIQAASQLKAASESATGREETSPKWLLMKEGQADTPSIIEWLKRKMSLCSNGGVVAVDGMLMSHSRITSMTQELRKIGATIRTNYDIISAIRKDRPELPHGDIFPVHESIIGETAMQKMERIREYLKENRCDAIFVSDLMSIAWTLNLRGSDVKQTPVFIGYLFIMADAGKRGKGEAGILFCNGNLTAEAKQMLDDTDIKVMPYDKIGDFLKKQDCRIMCDSSSTSFTLYNNIKCSKDIASPIPMMKAVKNEKEIEGFRASMLRDGVAMVKFLSWLKPAVEAGGQTEISISNKLEAFRREAQEFRDLSFDTICGYADHGAIVHYFATEETNIAVKPQNFILIDSGAQYADGTTDITRTIALGPVTEEMKVAYTAVLKANIALATVPFPEGMTGTNLDSIARSELWRCHLNYQHGTGHGVGSYLAVHEGPHSVRYQWNKTPLKPGMTITDEPGVYIEGKFGIRTENTMLVVKDSETEFGTFLRLESLTLCPIDTTPIKLDMLTPDEVSWLNSYHKRVEEAIMPLLTDETVKNWLQNACQPL